MLTDGYGAVTFRSVATAAGVAPGLVQYYFPSLDDLFIAVLRENTDRLITDLTDATDTEQPLRAVWVYASDPTGTALLAQFMALANHLPQVGSVIGEGGERVRRALLKALTKKWPEYGLDDTGLTPAAMLFLLSAIPRMIHLEEALGTVTGHSDAVALVERFLDRVEPRSS
jgi:AcrR family transcriptional regulator